jgi:hypothetical protein
MSRYEIIKLMEWHPSMPPDGPGSLLERVMRVVRKAEKDEREECAKVCEHLRDESLRTASWLADECSAAIRARG